MTDNDRVLALLADRFATYPYGAPDSLLSRVVDDVEALPQRRRWLGWRMDLGRGRERLHQSLAVVMAATMAVTFAIAAQETLRDGAMPGATDILDPSPSALTPPVIEIPAGVIPQTSAADIEREVRAMITRDEKRLGRALAEPRMLHMRYSLSGQAQELLFADGSNPSGSRMTMSGPGWLVEAQGTFLGVDPMTDRIDSHGVRAYLTFQEVGGFTGQMTVPCWVRTPVDNEPLDGACP